MNLTNFFKAFEKKAYNRYQRKPKGSTKDSEIERVRAQEANGEKATSPVEASRDYPMTDYKRLWP